MTLILTELGYIKKDVLIKVSTWRMSCDGGTLSTEKSSRETLVEFIDI